MGLVTHIFGAGKVVNSRSAGRRSWRPVVALLGVGLAASSLTGCGLLDWGSQLAPSGASATPSGPQPTPSDASASAAPSASPSPTPSETVETKATAVLQFHSFLVSNQLKGTCSSGVPLTISLTDSKNDFYTTVDVVALLDIANLSVTSIAVNTGEDSEGGIHNMSYSAAAPVAGTAARLAATGSTYTIRGTLQDQDSPHGKPATTLVPFTLQVTCKAK